ncbi:MAG: hypothetical protein LKI24_11120 [Acidipropionibacterium sp.]|jgi:hypothetical protein|nr:hypothetical protein [Acidipropionibacterium sp.]
MPDLIPEEAARTALLAAHSPAYDPRRYSAVRIPGGWLFVWAGELTSAPMGTRAWVVSDAGKATMVGIGESAARALTRLAGN